MYVCSLELLSLTADSSWTKALGSDLYSKVVTEAWYTELCWLMRIVLTPCNPALFGCRWGDHTSEGTTPLYTLLCKSGFVKRMFSNGVGKKHESLQIKYRLKNTRLSWNFSTCWTKGGITQEPPASKNLTHLSLPKRLPKRPPWWGSGCPPDTIDPQGYLCSYPQGIHIAAGIVTAKG